MLKTNSLKGKTNIRNYIMNDRDYLDERNEYHGKTLETEDEYLAFAWEIFKSEKKHEIEQNYSNPNFAIFKDWAQGLALGWLFCYYYNRSAVEDLGAILEETEAEKQKYSEQEAEELLTRLIYREMEAAYRREFLKTVKVTKD